MLNYKVLGFIALAVGTVGLILGISLFTIEETVYKPDYGIVVDAGSSHSGLILYEWPGPKKQSTGLVEQIADCTVDGGLAKIDPSNMSIYFDPCFQQLSQKINSNKRTPVFMGATAGMRILNLSDPDAVTQLFKSFADYISSGDNQKMYQLKQASIITGSDEGLFSWVTANHLLDNLLPKSGQDSTHTCAMLDMGGASAQIAYEINGTNPVEVSSDDLTTVRLYGVNHTVKSSSNLCFGVDQARLRSYAILRLDVGPKNVNISNPCGPIGSLINVSASELNDNKCLGTKENFNFEEDFYIFEGTSDPKKCEELSDKVVDINFCERTFLRCPDYEPSSAIDTKSVVALSSYFYSSNILNLDGDGKIRKEEFINQSNQFCSLNLNDAIKWKKDIKSKYVDVYCFQLKFIHSTLTKLYKLTTDWSNIVFKERIGSASLGWSLGLMINATNAIPSEAVQEPIIGSVSFSFMTINCILILCLAGFFFHRMKRRSRHEPLPDGNP